MGQKVSVNGFTTGSFVTEPVQVMLLDSYFGLRVQEFEIWRFFKEFLLKSSPKCANFASATAKWKVLGTASVWRKIMKPSAKVFGNNQKRETSCISEVTFLLSCFCNDIQYFPGVCTHQISSVKNSNIFFRRIIRFALVENKSCWQNKLNSRNDLEAKV